MNMALPRLAFENVQKAQAHHVPCGLCDDDAAVYTCIAMNGTWQTKASCMEHLATLVTLAMSAPDYTPFAFVTAQLAG